MITTTRYTSFISPGLVFTMACLLGRPAAAQTDPFARGDQLISGFTGPSFDLSGESEGNDLEGEEGVEFETSWVFGGNYQYFLSPKLSVEASLTLGTGEGEIEGPGTDDAEDSDDEGNEESEEENGEEGELGGNALYFTGGLTYHFRPDGRFRPYVTAGAGLARIDVQGSGSSRPAAVFGGGLLMGLSRSLLVRVDARDHLYALETGSGGSSNRNDLSLTGGVSIRF